MAAIRYLRLVANKKEGAVLKILHLSDHSDQRIKRAASTGVKAGHTCAFAGNPSFTSHEGLFSEFFTLNWGSLQKLHIPHFWSKLRKNFERIFAKYSPDVVHAHDVFAAKLCVDTGVPFIFDQHEFWHKDSGIRLVRKSRFLTIKRKAAELYGLPRWIRWQNEAISKAPTLAVSQPIADVFAEEGDHIFLVPNFPIANEVQGINFQKRAKVFSSVYIGNDFTVENPRRLTRHILPHFEAGDLGTLTILGDVEFVPDNPLIGSLGFLSHDHMFRELTQCYVGLIPWLSHPSHKYFLPDKTAEYIHAGLICVASEDLTYVKSLLGGYCLPFDSTEQFVEVMRELKTTLPSLALERKRIVEFARTELVWENYEQNILEAYSLA